MLGSRAAVAAPPLPTPSPLCSCRQRCRGAHSEDAAEQTPGGNSPQTSGPPRQGHGEGFGPCPTTHTRPGAFPRAGCPPPQLLQLSRKPPVAAGLLALSFPLSVPCCTVTQPRQGNVPCSGRGSASSIPWEGAVAAPGIPTHGTAPQQRCAEPPPALQAATAVEGSFMPPSPTLSTPCPSIPAAATHSRPGDLRGERGGRGVPADQGGGGP